MICSNKFRRRGNGVVGPDRFELSTYGLRVQIRAPRVTRIHRISQPHGTATAGQAVTLELMEFVPNGPDIPETLLEAHEEGRVVFFCGAGISYPAGLPGFRGLVDQIYEAVGTSPSPIEQEAHGRSQFDAVLDLLERCLPGQRLAVRQALKRVLQPKLRRKGALDTHLALLQLGRDREGSLRLVTTNFDRAFHAALMRTKEKVEAFSAPMLPIPKRARWNGLVYLHGVLPAVPDDGALNRLVVTSGDFGLAYLTERWAARFVSEPFRNYIVCFIGYSISDPVLRYMMDALAADRMNGTPRCHHARVVWHTGPAPRHPARSLFASKCSPASRRCDGQTRRQRRPRTASPARSTLGEVADLQLIRPLCAELPIDPVQRAWHLAVADRGPHDLAAHDASQSQTPHQPLHRAAGDAVPSRASCFQTLSVP
ncbi:MAG: hypothetical protein JWQ76_3649 [Ramlibacter sp.]|nr:hypothetical protein [Ramlibacter sp.]